MRLVLDPTSPSGIAVMAETIIQNRQSPGYVTDNISGLLTAGSNVTITGNGTKSSPYSIASSGGGGSLTDGDKGDITVSGSGSIWTVDTGLDAAKIGSGIVSNTEFGYLDGVTSALQTQINSKQATLTLTTTGTSGAATLVGATLNIPQYSAASGGITRTVVVTVGSFTAGSASATDYVYLHAGAHDATLPSASGNSNRYTFKNNHSASITVTRAGTDTIEGSTSITIPPQNSVDLISNGTSAWYVI